ncbi:MAG: TIGR03032 family protein [Cyanobacteria bacterium J06628_6]
MFTQASSNPDLSSVHTHTLAELLNSAGCSLMVTTYQAGKLIVVRADGAAVNTHFRQYSRPMGMAVNATRMAMGTAHELIEFYNLPAVAAKLEPANKHDACYLLRNIHITGDIDIHEMGWASDELWIVNTRFSCLCTPDLAYSFVPRWRPPFISGYSPDDRCHLNGLAIVNDQPKYVTALGTTNTSGGWRANKASGGILMDVQTNEIICQGLSMPHSPRWYGGKLWVLESGQGSLATVDVNTGQLTTVAQFPGFTRGIDFFGHYAFVGLSQVRESATFSGIPLVDRLTERTCGVWVVDLRSGQTVAFLKFKSGVQEIFAVSVLSHSRYPEVLEANSEFLKNSYALPDAALKDVV